MVNSCANGCNFNEAEQVCKAEGGKLAELTTKGEVQAFTDILPSFGGNWWTGATTLGQAKLYTSEYFFESDRKTVAQMLLELERYNDIYFYEDDVG